jgi:hypothetical protein
MSLSATGPFRSGWSSLFVAKNSPTRRALERLVAEVEEAIFFETFTSRNVPSPILAMFA